MQIRPANHRPSGVLVALVLLSALVAAGPPSQALPAVQLEDLAAAVDDLARPPVVDGIPDEGPDAMAERAEGVSRVRAALARLPASADRDELVDRLLVWARANAIDFDLRVVRPWARDPGLTVDRVRRVPYTEVPDDDDARSELATALDRVSRLVQVGRERLTDPSAQLASMAIRQLEASDGVNQGEPRRPVPPAGVLGWYDDLIGRLDAAGSPLLENARTARAAVAGFRDWLRASLPTMSEPAWVGLDNYDWYLRNVLLLPHDSVALRTLADRELARARGFLAIERHRNRDLPPIEPARSAEEHAERVEAAEAWIREFIARHDLLTVPEGIPPRFETDAFWIVREGGNRHFWEEITYRDPLNNHIHASIPGHRFDGFVGRRESRPLRARYRDGVRAEGWAFYIEEMFLQAGLLDDRPRAKELFYIAQLKRAARVPAELAMQTGAMDLEAAIDYLVAQVPLMEPNLARYDLAIYLRRPTYGMNYLMGKVLLEQLLSERALQLGEDFHLGAFHDEFLEAGPIPIPLIRWELTGHDDWVVDLLPEVNGLSGRRR